MPSVTTSKDTSEEQETFKLKEVFVAFATVPRVMKIVWAADVFLTLGLAIVTVMQGLTPAAQVIISQLVIDSVGYGIRIHASTPIWLPVILQLVVSVVDRFLSSAGTALEQLLQERVSNHVKLQILRKANTLDLSFFEDSTF